MIYFQREKPNTLPLDINKHWGIPPGEISRSSLTFTSKQCLGRTPQLCSPLTAMLNRPTTRPKKTDLYTWNPLTPHIFEQHISLSIKRDQKNNIKTTKKKVFSIFLKALWNHHF